MLLAIDIGNTNIHLGLFAPARGSLVKHLVVSVSNARRLCLDASILQGVSECLLASVNPVAEESFCRWLDSQGGKKPLKIPCDVPVHMPVLVKSPERVGIDRLLNALAAYHRTNAATIVVDVGTAVTIDAVSQRGEFLGGVIAPGLVTLKEALHRRTALLPEVVAKRPRHVLGKDTEEAIASGLYWGMVGTIERITYELQRELGGRPRILATGGDAELLTKEIKLIDEVVPHLTLEGILAVYNTRSCKGA